MTQPTIREWARANGYSVGERGRISAEITDAYISAIGQHPRPLVLKSHARKDINDVREWAKNNGFAVSERGRVSAKVKAAYDKAQKKSLQQSVDPYVLHLAQQMAAEKQKESAVVLEHKGVKFRTQFCCWPIEERFDKFHTICPGTIMNATLVGGVRKNVICSCECHND